jgi:hypothetical protein
MTMHTTDEQDCFWITCACGWLTDPVEVSTDEQWQPIQEALADLGRAHIHVGTEET